MKFKTADLCDANQDGVQVVLPGLKNFGASPRFYGEIVTIQATGDFSQVREQVHSSGTGKVLVIDNDGALDRAMLGDLLTAAAAENGWQGIVINGCIRDSVDIAGMNVGVKALATVPRRGLREGRGELNIEVEFLGASFRPREFLYSDEDGILLSVTRLI